MKKLFEVILCGLLITLPMTGMAQSTSDREAVNAVMQNFIRAYETGSSDVMRKAFHKDGVVIHYSARNAKLVTISGDEFTNRFDGKLAPDEAQRKRYAEILDITEHSAMVKVKLDYPTWDGVDYIAVSKIDGEWKITSKYWGGRVKTATK